MEEVSTPAGYLPMMIPKDNDNRDNTLINIGLIIGAIIIGIIWFVIKKSIKSKTKDKPSPEYDDPRYDLNELTYKLNPQTGCIETSMPKHNYINNVFIPENEFANKNKYSISFNIKPYEPPAMLLPAGAYRPPNTIFIRGESSSLAKFRIEIGKTIDNILNTSVKVYDLQESKYNTKTFKKEMSIPKNSSVNYTITVDKNNNMTKIYINNDQQFSFTKAFDFTNNRILIGLPPTHQYTSPVSVCFNQ